MTRNISKNFFFSLWMIVFVFCQPSVVGAQTGESGQSVYREQRSREGYTLNLRDLITESRNKISKVDDELKEQARRRRNQQREEKAREYYDKATRLFEEGNFEEAQVYWERAIKITEHPEMKDYVRESVKREKAKAVALQKEQNRQLQRLEVERGYSAAEVEAAYQDAVKLFKQKNYVAALEAFESVDNMFPDHKGTRSYLMLIHQEIQKEQAKIIEQKLQQDADDQRQEKEIWRRQLEEQDVARQDLQKEKANVLYAQAVRFYTLGDFVAAKEKFQEVEWLIPDFRSTIWYLRRIDRNNGSQNIKIRREDEQLLKERALSSREIELARQQMTPEERNQKVLLEREKSLQQRFEEEADFVYRGALKLYEQGDFDEAYTRFQEVQELSAGYKNTEDYLSRLESRGRALQAEALYQKAVAFYNDKAYEDAKIVFEELKQVWPGYRAMNRYLAKVDRQVVRGRVVVNSSRGSIPAEEPLKDMVENPDEVNTIVQGIIEERTRRFQEEAEDKYALALDFYERGNYAEAKIRFIQVEALIPGYKKTHDYLGRIDQEIANQRLEREKTEGSPQLLKAVPPLIVPSVQESEAKSVRAQYRQAVDLYRQKDFSAAKDQFLQIQQKDPKHRGAKNYLAKIERQLARLEKIRHKREDNAKILALAEPRTESEKPDSSVVSLASEETEQAILPDGKEVQYQEAVEDYDQGRYESAQEKFSRLSIQEPGYRSTEWYLGCIDQKLLELETGLAETQCLIQDKNFRAAEKRLDFLAGRYPFLTKTGTFKKQESVSLKSSLVKTKTVSAAKAAVLKRKQERIDERNRRRAEKQLVHSRKVDSNEKPLNWEKRRDQKYAEFKAKEAHLATLKGERYRAFRRQLDEERKRFESVERARQRMISQEKKKTRDRLREQENARIHEEREQSRLAAKAAQMEEKAVWEAEQSALKDHQAEKKVEFEKIRDEHQNFETRKQELETVQVQTENDFQAELDALKAKIDDIQNLFDRQMVLKNQEIEDLKRLIDANDLERVDANRSLGEQKEQKINLAESVPDVQDPAVKLATIEEQVKWQTENERNVAIRKLSSVQREQRELESRKEADLRRQRKEVKAYLARLDENQRARIRREVAAIYQEGLDLYKDGRILAARIKFNSVENLYPGYPGAQSYIARIDQLISQERQEYTEALVAKTVADEKAWWQQKDVEARLAPDRENAEREARAPAEPIFAMATIDEKSRIPSTGESSELTQEAGETLLTLSEAELASRHQKAAETEKLNQQHLLKQRGRQKEADKLAKQREREEMARQRQRQEHLRSEIQRIYDEALNSHANGHASLASEKFKEFERLLMGGGFSESYVRSMRARLGKEKEKIDRRLARAKNDEKKLLQNMMLSESSVEQKPMEPSQTASTSDVDLASQDVPPDLKILGQKIQADEQRLSQQRSVQERQVLEMKEREADLARREVMRENLRQQRLERQALKEEEMLRLEQAKRERIEMLEKQRKEAGDSGSLVASVESSVKESGTKMEDEIAKLTATAEPEVISARGSDVIGSRMADVDRQRRSGASDDQLALEQKLRLDETDRMTRNERRDLEKKRREELQLALKKRQDEIQQERKKIQQEFARNIDRLYGKAVGLFKSGDDRAAQGLFQEIERLKPSYKRTRRYLEQLDEKFPETSLSSRVSSASSETETTAARQITAPVSPRLSIIQQALDQLESR